MSAIRKSILSALYILFCSQTYAEVTVPENDQAAQDFYKNSQLIISKIVIDPAELAGSLVFKKAGEPDQYLNILPEGIRKTLKPQNLSTKPYRTMLNQQEAKKVGFLGLLGISTKEDFLLEISISDIWRLEGPSFLGDDEVKANALQIGKVYYDDGFSVWYNQSVQYALLVTSKYKKSDKNIQGTFTYIGGDGKRYVQEENYTQKELISTAPFNLTTILAKLPTGKLNVNALKIESADVNSLIKKGVPSGVMDLTPATLEELKAASGKLDSKEFKLKIQQLENN
jgi:hypothetical protein